MKYECYSFVEIPNGAQFWYKGIFIVCKQNRLPCKDCRRTKGQCHTKAWTIGDMVFSHWNVHKRHKQLQLVD